MTHQIVLQALIKHETLTLPDLLQQKNLETNLPAAEVESALDQLVDQKLVTKLNDVAPPTFTITSKGIEHGSNIESEI